MIKELIQSKYNKLEFHILRNKYLYHIRPKTRWGKSINPVSDRDYDNMVRQFRILRETLKIPDSESDVTKIPKWDDGHKLSKIVKESIYNNNLPVIVPNDYNTIMVCCPACDEFNSLKSTTGSRNGKTIMIEAADIADLVDIINEPIQCSECDDEFMIVKYPLDIRPTIIVYKESI